MDRETRRPPATDDRMSLREWSRTRRVPLSTAHKAAQSRRITRDIDGKLDPVRADREWYENTRPRVDMRHPVVPTDPTEAVTELPPMSRQELEERYGAPAPDPDETVRVVDALTVEAQLEDLLAVELLAALNRAILDIAPKLARSQDGRWMAERLYNALLDGWVSTESEWRRRYPREELGAAVSQAEEGRR